jgi:hypothetical protein
MWLLLEYYEDPPVVTERDYLHPDHHIQSSRNPQFETVGYILLWSKTLLLTLLGWIPGGIWVIYYTWKYN